MLSICTILLVGVLADGRSAAALLPQDTSVLLVCDDVAGLRAAARSLPAHDLLLSGDHDELVEQLDQVCASLATRAFPGASPSDLNWAAIAQAFVAWIPEPGGTRELVAGLKWDGSPPEGLKLAVPLTDPDAPGPRTRSVEGWTIVTRSAAMDARIAAVAADQEPALAADADFLATSTRVRHTAKGAVFAWVAAGPLRSDPLGDVGAVAWSGAIEAGDGSTREPGDIVSELFISAPPEGTALCVAAPESFEDAWLALVPTDARAFSWNQWRLPELAAAAFQGLSSGEEDASARFARSLGQHALVIAPDEDIAITPAMQMFLQVRSAEDAEAGLAALIEAIESAHADRLHVERSNRGDAASPGGTVYSIRPAIRMPIPLTFVVTIEDQWLVLTTKAATLVDQIARVRALAGKGAPDAADVPADVRSNPRFARRYAELARVGSPYHGVSFVDPSKALGKASGVVGAVAARLLALATDDAGDPMVGDSLAMCIDELPPSVAITRGDGEGWYTRRRGCVAGELSLAWPWLGPAARVLPSLIAANVQPMIERARRTKAQSDLRALDVAIISYFTLHGALPETLETLAQPDDRNFGESHIAGCDFRDPWNRPYLYERGEGPHYRIATLGADGAPGGEGDDADLVREH